MTITTRPCTAHDAESIGRLASEFQAYLNTLGDPAHFDWGAEKYLRDGFRENPAFEGIVAEVDAQIVAFALFHFGYDTDQGQRIIYLIDLFVSQSSRRLGVGETLMREVAAAGRARGAELMAWSVLKHNASAIRFYEDFGAKRMDDSHVMWTSI